MNLLSLVTVAILAATPITAQKVVEEVAARHPEITSLEIAAARSAGEECRTIAATDPKDIGGKCDSDELKLMQTDKLAVDKEREGFDVTIPLHDASGAVIALVGITLKLPPTESRAAAVIEQARKIVSEIEKRLSSRSQLFAPAR